MNLSNSNEYRNYFNFGDENKIQNNNLFNNNTNEMGNQKLKERKQNIINKINDSLLNYENTQDDDYNMNGGKHSKLGSVKGYRNMGGGSLWNFGWDKKNSEFDNLNEKIDNLSDKINNTKKNIDDVLNTEKNNISVLEEKYNTVTSTLLDKKKQLDTLDNKIKEIDTHLNSREWSDKIKNDAKNILSKVNEKKTILKREIENLVKEQTTFSDKINELKNSINATSSKLSDFDGIQSKIKNEYNSMVNKYEENYEKILSQFDDLKNYKYKQ